MDGATYYELLGVSETASSDEIVAAYRKLIAEYHPDTLPPELRGRRIFQDAEDMARMLNDAKAVLVDPAKRREYDALLAELRSGTAPPTEQQSASTAAAAANNTGSGAGGNAASTSTNAHRSAIRNLTPRLRALAALGLAAVIIMLLRLSGKPVSTTDGAAAADTVQIGMRRGIAEFTGRVTNRGYKSVRSDPISADLTLTVDDSPATSAYLAIQPPLGGSGDARMYAWADSVLILTVSATGDTIAWLGTRDRDRLTGSYTITGGQWVGQGGDWFLVRSRGPALQQLVVASRPFADSVDIAALLRSLSTVSVKQEAEPATLHATPERVSAQRSPLNTWASAGATPAPSQHNTHELVTDSRRLTPTGADLTSDRQPGAVAADDRESIEAACAPTRAALGPGAYNRCVATAAEQLFQHPRPSFATVGAADREGIESSCRPSRAALGPGAYNACLEHGIAQLQQNPLPEFGGISDADRTAVEGACRPAKGALGPGAYNACVANAITQLRQNPTPSFAGIADGDHWAIDGVCRPARNALGPGAYNQCLANAISQLRQNPPVSLSGIRAADRESIENACRPSRAALGPGSYNQCVANAVRELDRNPSPR